MTVNWRLRKANSKPRFGTRASIEAFLNVRWYGRAGVLHLLHPFAWLYAGVTRWARRRAEARFEQDSAARLPTIVVGNVVAGGTGKTPVVAELARELKALGAQPGIVTRGYGGASSSWPLLVGHDTDPGMCGDEAVELAQTTGCPVVAGPDRPACVSLLAQCDNCDVVISDDGLQHYAMARDLEIVLVDGSRQFGNGYQLPVGPLREPVSRVQEAQLIVVTSRSLQEAEIHKSALSAITKEGPALLLGCALIPVEAESLLKSNAVAVAEAPFTNKPCIALSAIGQPERFHQDLEALGCSVDPQVLADHQGYARLISSGTLQRWAEQNWVVTTGKDAVKLRFALAGSDRSPPGNGYDRVWVLKRRVVFSGIDLLELRRVLAEFARVWELGLDSTGGLAPNTPESDGSEGSKELS